MPAPHWSTKLEPFRPCAEALEYARSKPSFAAAWRDCERGDWMLWILGKLSGPPDSASRKALVAAAVDCAVLARKFASGETRKAFNLCQRTTRKYLRGAATLAEVRSAVGTTVCADAAAYAAAYAAFIAYTDLVASAASNLAAAAAADQMRTLSRCASVVRRHYPNPPRLRKGA